MAVQAPEPSNRHAWYAHSSSPVSSTRPSESGARRCGHASSNARHVPSERCLLPRSLRVLSCVAPSTLPSFHSTTSLPSTL
jgi:hypothetical protein